MSRIGKLPIKIPSGVTVEISGDLVTVKGPKGEEKVEIPNLVKVTMDDQQVICNRENDEPQSKATHGLVRSLLNNCIVGVNESG